MLSVSEMFVGRKRGFLGDLVQIVGVGLWKDVWIVIQEAEERPEPQRGMCRALHLRGNRNLERPNAGLRLEGAEAFAKSAWTGKDVDYSYLATHRTEGLPLKWE